MSREIKFRAWDGKAIRELLALSFLNEEAAVRFPTKGSMKAIKLSKLSLMQFTGLLDKNGVEIYEGDIIEILANMFEPDGATERHEVVFERGMFKTKDGVSLDVSAGILFKPTVVANIYEN